MARLYKGTEMTGYESKKAAARDKMAQPAQRPWVGLTAEEQTVLVYKYGDTPVALCLETERKLKQKNT